MCGCWEAHLSGDSASVIYRELQLLGEPVPCRRHLNRCLRESTSFHAMCSSQGPDAGPV